MYQKNQHIGCDVNSCVYNENGSACSLQSITVQACQNCSSGNPQDESMCSNYRHR